MSKRTVYYVNPHEDGWQVKKEKAKRATSVHGTKEEAKQEAIRRAKESKLGQVKIQKRDGTFEEERTYGKDPKRYRD